MQKRQLSCKKIFSVSKRTHRSFALLLPLLLRGSRFLLFILYIIAFFIAECMRMSSQRDVQRQQPWCLGPIAAPGTAVQPTVPVRRTHTTYRYVLYASCTSMILYCRVQQQQQICKYQISSFRLQYRPAAGSSCCVVYVIESESWFSLLYSTVYCCDLYVVALLVTCDLTINNSNKFSRPTHPDVTLFTFRVKRNK